MGALDRQPQGQNLSERCSVLLPVFNGAQMLLNSLPHFLSLMEPNDELLLINDGSEDLSSANLRFIEALDERIRIINKPHSGLIDTLNFGIREASYNLIARVDVDDTYSSERLTRQRDFLRVNNRCVAVFSDYEIYNSKSESMGLIASPIHSQLCSLSLVNPQRLAHPSVMFRKDAVVDAGNYNTSAYLVEDLDLWKRLVSIGDICSVPEILLKYRMHSSSISVQNQSQMRLNAEVIVREHAKSLNLDNFIDFILENPECYSGIPNSEERYILLYRDLFKLASLKGFRNSRGLLKILPSHLMRHIEIKTIVDLALEKWGRQKYRTKP